MQYLEIADSKGKGTLVNHRVIKLKKSIRPVVTVNRAVQTLTEPEARQWYADHGNSWVSV